MSFLAGRLAATEGAYFRQESKQAVNRIIQKIPKAKTSPSSSSSSQVENEVQADVLHEVLRHSLPPQSIELPPLGSSLSTSSKWVLRHDPDKTSSSSFSSDARNPLRAYVSLPQVTMGPKRWQLPDGEHSFSASTANALRQDMDSHVNPEKLKAAAEGLSQIGKAFFLATTIVFGGAVVAFGMLASKLELQNSDDIKTKGRDLVHPKFENMKEQLVPLRIWAENKSKKWHFEREEEVKDNLLVKELSKRLGHAKTTN
ncbi:Coiled-coil protein [Thalictrum thalictroides]|uniref:Coiled-coil protein n=1 Tax=Thalictrum thalictroides TaxID=46969 RepID=A0A7J6X3Q5_THATH|nr:Coiled-coil protein [Thalictrum thalictroides]